MSGWTRPLLTTASFSNQCILYISELQSYVAIHISLLSPLTSPHRFVTDYVHCQSCGNFSGRADTYLDISLNVKDLPSLQDSFRQFLEPEVLENDNAYFCSKCQSKQKALKGIRLRTFPYLLTVQLKRFEMNWQLMRRVKVHQMFEFPEYLDVSPYLDKENVHASGTAAAGNPRERPYTIRCLL